jgi:hypothetical protein
MGLKREFSIIVQKLIDEWLPPVLCDAKWFVRLPMKLAFKDAADDVMYFREKAFAMTDEEFAEVYRRVYGQIADRGTLTRETDLNKRCVKEILSSLRGETVLDVGAGRGYLAGLMSTTHKVTAVDMVVTDGVRNEYPQVTFVESPSSWWCHGNGRTNMASPSTSISSRTHGRCTASSAIAPTRPSGTSATGSTSKTWRSPADALRPARPWISQPTGSRTQSG